MIDYEYLLSDQYQIQKSEYDEIVQKVSNVEDPWNHEDFSKVKQLDYGNIFQKARDASIASIKTGIKSYNLITSKQKSFIKALSKQVDIPEIILKLVEYDQVYINEASHIIQCALLAKETGKFVLYNIDELKIAEQKTFKKF